MCLKHVVLLACLRQKTGQLRWGKEDCSFGICKARKKCYRTCLLREQNNLFEMKVHCVHVLIPFVFVWDVKVTLSLSKLQENQ